MIRWALLALLLGAAGCACNSLHESLHGIFPFCTGGDVEPLEP